MTRSQAGSGAVVGSGSADAPRDTVVAIEDLSFAYRGHEDRPVLREINLHVERGEIFGIAGGTGSGKSTLCYALTGIVPHSLGGHLSGRVCVDGVDTSTATVAELTRWVSLVMQSPESQIVGLTVREDVEFGLENIALEPAEIVERGSWALRTVRLDGFDDRSPWELSGGQKQRLAIASAIAFHPSVLVLDNPTAELDPLGKQEVLETLVTLNAELGTTIVIVDQELQEIVPHVSRIALLEKGELVALGSAREILDRADLLHRIGIRLPEVTEVAARLRQVSRWNGPLPIDVNEARPQLLALVSGDGRQPAAHLPAGVPMSRPARPTSAGPPLPGAEPALRVEGLHFTYPGGAGVLDGISLVIEAGAFIALMGPNGAGKTTLAKHFNGLLRPTAGAVYVHGVDTRTRTVAQLAPIVGYVFQNPDHQVFSETVARELAFGPQNLGWPASRIDEAVARTLADLGLTEQADAQPFFLGLAERKLLALGSTLIMGPDILVLDEPATGADHLVSLRIMRYISELHRRGLTVVIITHDVALAAQYTDRLIVVRDGRIVLDGPPAEVFRHEDELRASFVRPPPTVELARALEGRVSQEITCVDELVAALAAS